MAFTWHSLAKTLYLWSRCTLHSTTDINIIHGAHFILYCKGRIQKSRLHEIILNYDVNNDYTYQLNATLKAIQFYYTRDVLMMTEKFSKIIIVNLILILRDTIINYYSRYELIIS